MRLYHGRLKNVEKTEHLLAYGEAIQRWNDVFKGTGSNPLNTAINNRYGREAVNYIVSLAVCSHATVCRPSRYVRVALTLLGAGRPPSGAVQPSNAATGGIPTSRRYRGEPLRGSGTLIMGAVA
jgi:hypothetical protein